MQRGANNVDFFIKYLTETIEAINNYIEKNTKVIYTKSIRTYHEIKPSNRSKINFIWRSLKYLENQGILRVNGVASPKKYEIIPKEKIDINQFLNEVKIKK